MLIAGDPSGDLVAAELVRALRETLAGDPRPATLDSPPPPSTLAPRFFGAGGPRMQAAGVDLAFDMTRHSLIGLSDVFRKYLEFRRLFARLRLLAIERQPDAIVCVDFSGFNRRFAGAIRRYVRPRRDAFHPWNPRIIQYVSPQVWASRAGRVRQIARDFDLVLSTIPFEKAWYADRAPGLPVEFVGNPVVERYGAGCRVPAAPADVAPAVAGPPCVVLLPGSRAAELRRHIPLVKEAARRMAARAAAQFVMVLPREELLEPARVLGGEVPNLRYQVGQLERALAGASLALTKSGTVTLECALFGVPAVVFYKTSALNYAVGKRVVKVKHIAMPNLLAGEAVFPEFIQQAATPENIAEAGIRLLTDDARRGEVRRRLAEVVATLGGSGASRRAAEAVLRLVGQVLK